MAVGAVRGETCAWDVRCSVGKLRAFYARAMLVFGGLAQWSGVYILACEKHVAKIEPTGWHNSSSYFREASRR